MPFNRPWATPSSGHLVYGVNSDIGRRGYIRSNPHFKGKGTYTIDQFNLTMEDSLKVKAQDQEAFLQAIAIHIKYRSALAGDGTANEIVRRKCKAGLEWATQSKRHVHFVLDDIDIDAVIIKNFTGKNADKDADGTSPKNRAVTGAELRWIYRNREDRDVINHIQFWAQGQQCVPPWEADVTVRLGRYGDLKTFSYTNWANYRRKDQPLPNQAESDAGADVGIDDVMSILYTK